MAISNYTELQAAVARWLLRGDLTAVIPDLIILAESRINRLVRSRSMEIVDDIPITGQSVTFPDRMIDLLGLVIVSGGIETGIQKIPYSDLVVSSETTIPSAYSVTNEIVFNCNGAGCAARINYIKGLDIALDSTNWVLTNYPDVYLFSTLIEGAAYSKQPISVVTGWSQRFDIAIAELNRNEARNKLAPLRTDLVGLIGI